MDRRLRHLLVSSLITALVGLLTACRSPAAAETPESPSSQRPQPLAIPAIRRIVSLTPSLTEIAFAVGAGDRMVGVSDYCDYPPQVRSLPRIGSFLRPNIERVLSLRPDLVLLDGVQGDVAGMLQGAGVSVMRVPMENLSQLRQAILGVGERLGHKAEAEAVVASIDRDLDAVAPPPGTPRPRVLFVVDRDIGALRGLVAAGPGTYLDELITRAGGDNIFSDLALRYAKVSVEAVTARRPEVIFDAVHVDWTAGQHGAAQDSKDATARVLADWQELGDVPAVRGGQVFLLQHKEFVTPGPRLGMAVRELAQLLHGGLLSQR